MCPSIGTDSPWQLQASQSGSSSVGHGPVLQGMGFQRGLWRWWSTDGYPISGYTWIVSLLDPQQTYLEIWDRHFGYVCWGSNKQLDDLPWFTIKIIKRISVAKAIGRSMISIDKIRMTKWYLLDITDINWILSLVGQWCYKMIAFFFISFDTVESQTYLWGCWDWALPGHLVI